MKYEWYYKLTNGMPNNESFILTKLNNAGIRPEHIKITDKAIHYWHHEEI